jgi:hypothetical protein
MCQWSEYLFKDGSGQKNIGIVSMDNTHRRSFNDRGRIAIAAVTVIVWALSMAVSVPAAENSIEKILPAQSCADGWVMEDKVKLYNKDNLFDRINGEAELYFPYGFEALASARYVSVRNLQHSVEADVYKMGSLLDAFGIYANYRRAEDNIVNTGAEGTLSSSLLLFYQGRYFVRLQASGTLSIEKDVFLACANAISLKLPDKAVRPTELEAFMLPQVVKNSERYIAQSLLGYAFLRRGIIADVMIDSKQAQVFVVNEDSEMAARKVFDEYRSYLKVSDSRIQTAKGADYKYVSAADPLYGKVIVAQAGRHVFGIIRIEDIAASRPLLDQIGKKLRN